MELVSYISSLAERSACLITNQNVTASISDTSSIWKGLERGPPSLELLDWEVADLIKEVDTNRIDGA